MSMVTFYPKSDRFCAGNPEALQITHGCNRHQHWQKQIGFGLVGNEDGIPFYGDVHDGNRSDKAWNPEVLSRIHEQFKQAKIDDEWIDAADSAAMTKDALAQTKAANAFLVTRGPSSLRIVKRAWAEADSPHIPWSEPFALAERNGATHRVWETASTYEGHPVRLIVVESSALDQRKRKTLEKERVKEAELLREEQIRWERHLFSCREDAEQALTSLKASLRSRFHRVEAAVEEIVRPKKRRGRPKKGAEPEMETLHLLRLDIEFDHEA
ncbi:putative transposase [Geobacillus kaustophilus]|uniref:Putative transposase n=1 Tax=Geobacillus kaustophilus TaxID=1462 RepID=A0A0D8BPH3_GEOKU|nr:putative transposase [Geobacillus kaustophilus]